MSFVYDLYVDNNLNVVGDTNIEGNLYVHGTTTSVNTDNLNVKDRHIYLNDGHTNVSTETGGIVVNYLPTATNDTVNGNFTTTTVVTTGSATFAAGDIIQVSFPTPNTYTGERANFGIFEVATHVTTTLTISTSSDFAQTAFVADTVTGATITKVNITIMQASASGAWETTTGATATELTTNIKTVLLSGDSTSNAALTLTDTTNQLTFDPSGGTFDTTISAPEPGQNSVITIPDSGNATASFVLTEGTQILNGSYTIDQTGSLVFEDTTGDHTYTIGVGELTANSTYSLPALDGAHTFVMSADSDGQILQANGAVGAPTYSFTNDTDSGIYHDGADSVNIAYGGSSILEVTATGIVVNGSITSTGAVVESVKDWAGAGAHVMTVSGTGSERVHYVTHTTAASITLPSVAAAQDGIKFTIINLLDANNDLTINRSDTDTLDNGVLTSLVLRKRHQRLTLQYIDAVSNWYIV